MSEGLRVCRLSIQQQVGLKKIIEQLDPNGEIPRPEGEFQIVIDVAPAIVRSESVTKEENTVDLNM